MSCQDCKCATCLDIRKDNMTEKHHKFMNRGWDLLEAWDNEVYKHYPKYLPSFDEFLNDFSYLMEGLED